MQIWNKNSSKINLERKEQQIDNDPFFWGMRPFPNYPDGLNKRRGKPLWLPFQLINHGLIS